MQRVVIVFPGALGDCLLALPALRRLRRRHRGAHVTCVVTEPLRGLVGMAGVADGVASLDAADAARLFADGDPPGWLGRDAAVYSWLGATDDAVRARVARWATAARFFRVVRDDGPRHAALAYLDAIGEPADAAGLPAESALVVSRAADPPAAPGRAPLLVVHAGGGAGAKRWPVERVAAVVAWWRARGGVVTEVRGPAEGRAADVGADAVVAGLDVASLATVLAQADRYLGNDSGPSHLAGAVGTVGVVVFGPTRPARWRPASRRIAVVAPALPGPIDAVASEAVVAALRASQP